MDLILCFTSLNYLVVGPVKRNKNVKAHYFNKENKMMKYEIALKLFKLNFYISFL